MSSAPQSTAASRSQHIWLKHPSRGIRLLVKSGRLLGSSPGRDVPILEGDAGPVPSPTEADRSAPAQEKAAAIRETGKRVAALFHSRQEETSSTSAGQQFVLAIQEQEIKSSLVQRPVAHRPGVDMKKTRVWIPTNPATLPRAGGLHCRFVARIEANIERAPVDVLAVFGDPEVGTRQHRIGLTRAVGREYGCTRLPDGIHDTGEKIEHADIDHRFLARMVVPQEFRELSERHCDRAYVVAKRAIEGFAGMGVDEPKAPKRHRGPRPQGPWQCQYSTSKRKETSPIHRSINAESGDACNKHKG